jgi:hypothetical protein
VYLTFLSTVMDSRYRWLTSDTDAIVKRWVPVSDRSRVLDDFDTSHPSANATASADPSMIDQLMTDFLIKRGYIKHLQPTPLPPVVSLRVSNKPKDRSFLVGKRTKTSKDKEAKMTQDEEEGDETMTPPPHRASRRPALTDAIILDSIRHLSPPREPYSIPQLAKALVVRLGVENRSGTAWKWIYERVKALKEFQDGELSAWVLPGRQGGAGGTTRRGGPKVKPYTTKSVTTSPSPPPHGAAAASAAVHLHQDGEGSDSEPRQSHGRLSDGSNGV